MSDIIPFIKPKEKEQVCSFCKTPTKQCKSVVGAMASEHCICEKCILQCKKRIEESK